MTELERYLQAKLPVFPVQYRGKEPALVGGKQFRWGQAKLPEPELFEGGPFNIGLRLDNHIEIDPDDPIASIVTSQLFSHYPTSTWGRASRPGKRLYLNSDPSE